MHLSTLLTTLTTLPLFTAITLLAHPAHAVDTDTNPTLAFELFTANSRLDRLSLTPDSTLKYAFTSNPHYSLSPGSVTTASAATWPVLRGIGLSLAQLNLAPCSILPPHLHRNFNIVVSAKGTTETYMIQENGARVVRQTLREGEVTVFPEGSLHGMINRNCEGGNVLYSFMGGEDAGTLTLVNALFGGGVESGILGVVMPWLKSDGENGTRWDEMRGQILGIGNGVVQGNEECLRRCGLGGNGTGMGYGNGTAGKSRIVWKVKKEGMD